MIRFKNKGDFSKTRKTLERMRSKDIFKHIDRYGKWGVEALSAATPIDSGKTSESWGYEVERYKTGFRIIWTNDNIAGNTPVAILIQYGHGTRDGHYVQGIDYINPALSPVFERIAIDLWKEVHSK